MTALVPDLSCEIKLPEDQMERLIDQMTALSAELKRYMEPLLSNVARIAKEMEPMVQAVVLSDRIAEASKVSGWLPYRTVPYGQYDRECGGEIDAFSVQISRYYKSHSQTILQDIDSRLVKHDMDGEAKATIREALEAHEHGLYRCVCRVLLPEIERVIREDWFGIADVETLKQSLIENEINKKYLEDFALSGPADFVLFDHFSNDMFAFVKNRQQVQQQSTTNRHAASHGWMSYASMQYSLNTIICADYIFRMVASFKKK